MLVLSRKLDESIIVRVGNEEIVFTIVEVSGKRTKIGIEAPQHLHILRGELLERSASDEKN